MCLTWVGCRVNVTEHCDVLSVRDSLEKKKVDKKTMSCCSDIANQISYKKEVGRQLSWLQCGVDYLSGRGMNSGHCYNI